LTAYEMDES